MWTKTRHRVVFAFLRPIMRVYTRLKYGYTAVKYPLEKGKPYLVLSNHQTGFDQFDIALSFKRPLYYIASDDLFSNRYSGFIEYLVAPIPKSKSAKDLESVRNCYRIAKEGGTICVFPEGNRTFSGVTETIEPSISKLVKLLKLPVVFYRFSGGYGVQPRWANRVRKGKMRGEVLSVMPEEEYRKMDDETLYRYICEQLHENECDVESRYRSKALAEYMERVFYYCPDCGGLADFVSEGDRLTCKACGMTVRYTEHNTFETVCRGRHLPSAPRRASEEDGESAEAETFRTTKQWYDAQTAFARDFDFEKFPGEIFGDDGVSLTESVRCKKKIFMTEGRFTFSAGRLGVNGTSFSFDEITSMTVLGKNKINFYVDGRIYQLKGQPRFNAVRVINLYYSYKIQKGETDDRFMGL